jgi:hypothetical protein
MARIRSVHPSLFTDEAWVSCSPLARVFYIGLMTVADDQGLFEWKALQLKMQVLPADSADVPALLEELVSVDLIAELNSGGKRLGAIRYFRRFQRPKKPNSIFVLPEEWRTYVGLKADGSELADSEDGPVPNQFPTSAEKSPQMEDGGGRREDGREESNDPSLAASAPAARSNSSKKVGLPKGYPDDDAVAEAERWIADAGVKLDARAQAKRFRSHALSNGRKLADWTEGWRGWIEIECENAPKAAAAEPAKASPLTWDGPQDVWDDCVAAMGEAYTRTYLGRSTWQASPPAILARNRMGADVLAKAALGVDVIPPTSGARK